MSNCVSAIVLAGGKNSPEMFAAMGVDNRALVELAPGRTMLDHVVEALSGASNVGEVIVVGDVPQTGGAKIVAPGETLLDNILRGIDAAAIPKCGDALIVTSDIPFITSEAVDDFVTRASALDADLCYPIIPMDAYNREFAEMKRTTLKLRDGHFTGGNMVLLDADRIHDYRDVIMKAYAARKHVGALGSMLGWGLLLRILISQTLFPNILTVAELEAGVARLLGPGATVRAVVTEYASIGTDVDKPDDVAFARRRLAAVESAVGRE